MNTDIQKLENVENKNIDVTQEKQEEKQKEEQKEIKKEKNEEENEQKKEKEQIEEMSQHEEINIDIDKNRKEVIQENNVLNKFLLYLI